MTVAAFVGLGSNLDDPATQVATAAEELRGLSAGHFALSPLYASKAVGPGEQPDYVNAVAQLETGDAPLALLHSLQQIEQRHGRVRTQRWGARTLDLDLLLYGDLTLSHRDLTLPPPRIAEAPRFLRVWGFHTPHRGSHPESRSDPEEEKARRRNVGALSFRRPKRDLRVDRRRVEA